MRLVITDHEKHRLHHTPYRPTTYSCVIGPSDSAVWPTCTAFAQVGYACVSSTYLGLSICSSSVPVSCRPDD